MTPSFRLYQLISPSLPVGAFSYSQGLEWAVEHGWVDSEQALVAWLDCLAVETLQYLELPLLRRCYDAVQQDDMARLNHWAQLLYASRETAELRQEERQRARTMMRLLADLELLSKEMMNDGTLSLSSIAGFAYAGSKWGIDIEELCKGYAWSWLENSVMAGVKLVPLGQTAGQRVLMQVSDTLTAVVDASTFIQDKQIGSFSPAQAIASSRHEDQYTRLFRS